MTDPVLKQKASQYCNEAMALVKRLLSESKEVRKPANTVTSFKYILDPENKFTIDRINEIALIMDVDVGTELEIAFDKIKRECEWINKV